MFGYIRTHRPQLKVWEDEAYKGVYCSLCRELGKRYGLFSRMFLSYDSSFLAVSLLALSDKCVSFNKKRCPFNAAKKCNFCTESRDEIKFAADISVLLLYHKIADNIRDSTLFKALLFRILLIFVKRYYKKASRLAPEAAEITERCMKLQYETENKQTKSVDEACEPTATLLKELYSLNESDGDTAAVRGQIGYHLGRWVYMIDAFDDLEKDKKSGSYNPFLLSENYNPEQIKGDLLMAAGETVKAYRLLKVKHFGGIMENVLIDGLYYETIKVYERRTKND